MYKFEQTDFGIRVMVAGLMGPDEVNCLKSEFVSLVAEQDGDFSLLVDATELVPPEPASKNLLQECEELALSAGMQRMAIVLRSPVLRFLVRQIAHLSGSASVAKYIDASKFDDPERMALAWVADGIDPEAEQVPTAGQDKTNV